MAKYITFDQYPKSQSQIYRNIPVCLTCYEKNPEYTCDKCNELLCSNHIYVCNECECNLCYDDQYTCIECKDLVCKNHFDHYIDPDEYMCNKCEQKNIQIIEIICEHNNIPLELKNLIVEFYTISF